MRAADAAVRVLEEFGVRHAFCVPGESFLGLLDALASSQIRVVAARHEGGAAFMAEAVGKLTGVPAICMGTRGVGSANLAVGIHTAYQDSTPLIALLGQVETKAGVIGLTKSLARELTAHRVNVNAIAPGLIDTVMSRARGQELSRQGVLWPRIGRPEDIAALAVYLASDEAEFVTGQVIGINGGARM